MNVVAALCHRFPEAALVARRFLDKSGKRAAETKPRKGHAFDPTKLVQYLHETVGAPRDVSEINIGQFSHGQSNPTFTVRWGDKAVVVRKQPGGKLLKGAHDVGREYQFASHLGKKGVPTPHALALCDDTDILGTRFWVYDYVDGRHFRDPYLERASVDERPLLYKSAARAAATLHGARRRPIAASTASAMAGGSSTAMWPEMARINMQKIQLATESPLRAGS